MKKNLRKNKKGFTLIEIIVVLVIMGILLAIAVPSVLGYVNKARDQQYLAEARSAFLAAQSITVTEKANGTKAAAAKTKIDDVTKLNAEIGDNGKVSAASCSIEAVNATDDTIKGLSECNFQVTGLGDGRYINIKANKTAEVIKATTMPTLENTPKQ